jgi:hypothetical protein
MYHAAVKQAHERADREGQTMVIYRSEQDGDLPIWYVRSIDEGPPHDGVLIEVISCSTSPIA